MKAEDRDVALEALEVLRRDDALRSAAETHPPSGAGSHRVRHGSRRLRFALAVGAGVLATGGTLAATVGIERVRAWWFGITVEGASTSGWVEGEGERAATFTTRDGCEVRVVVRRSGLDGPHPRTELEVVERGPGSFTEDVETVDHELSASLPLDRAALTGAERLHAWSDARGRRLALHVQPQDPEGGSRILLEELDADDAVAVRVVGTMPDPLGPDVRVTIVDDDRGRVEFLLEGPGDFACQLLLGEVGPSDGLDYTSDDGRVRVQIAD